MHITSNIIGAGSISLNLAFNYSSNSYYYNSGWLLTKIYFTRSAGDPSIITMGAGVVSNCASQTLQYPLLSSIAAHITKPDRTAALTKHSITFTLSTYEVILLLYSIAKISVMIKLTIRTIFELFADNFSIAITPAIVTDGSPLVIMTQLHSTPSRG